MSKKLKICLIIYYLFIITSFIMNGLDHLLYLIMCILIPPVLEMILPKFIKLTDTIRCPFLIFSAFAMIGGHTMHFYSFPYFDKILHTTSGILISILIAMIYAYLNNSIDVKNTKEKIIQYLFINGTNAMIAFIWELFEFSLLVFFNIDSINHYTTGVYDSITDMLVAFIGGIIVTLFIDYYHRTKKDNIITKIIKEYIKI